MTESEPEPAVAFRPLDRSERVQRLCWGLWNWITGWRSSFRAELAQRQIAEAWTGVAIQTRDSDAPWGG